MRSRGKPSLHSVRVLSLNVWTSPERLLERTEEIAAGILQLDPAVACLQEVSNVKAKQLLRERLSPRYHMLCSEHTELAFPALTWVPALLFALLTHGALAWWFGGSGAIPRAAAALGLALSAALTPRPLFLLLRFLLIRQRGDPLTLRGLFPKVDLMGQCILVRRGPRGWAAATVVSVQPFPAHLRGYPTPTSVRQWPEYWIQHCLLRPGCFIVRCEGVRGGGGGGGSDALLVASAHLVVSAPGTSVNARRLAQVQQLHAAIAAVQRLPGGDDATVVCCGDFNAPDDSAEIRWLSGPAGGFVDAAATAATTPRPRFLTWDSALNANTQSDPGEPDARLDYVFARAAGGGGPVSVSRCTRVFDGGAGHVGEDSTGALPIVSDHFGVLADVTIG